MGGTCFLFEEDTENAAPEGQQTTLKKTAGPPCTDNFQIKNFTFEGKQWQSVEQCYQAMKYTDDKTQELLRTYLPYKLESEWQYGCRVWELGQCRPPSRPEWGTRKVEYMYQINVAKYLAYPELQQELLATGNKLIKGAPSTGNWEIYNGLIQTRIRHEIRQGVLGEEMLSGAALDAALKEPVMLWVEKGLL
eukprot:CAMPEP_0181311326 /NCGR_PEP_ID=MMETSP1101-20121128/13072_1 /TAXON_ID=46948 /ORGANISM="Rhodomonas abbreviata, Strain Caron Lab Isolate" /LENGTH=191 /DNA_ID=CAMNT_0023418039 /DNA_START=45 /DNA_END=620 /DNA_ORIENTATION=-